MISDLLHNIGFSDKEIEVYTAILGQGRMRYADLSRKTGLNRTTVYSVVRELLERGVLQEDFSSPVKTLVAAPPEALSAMTAKEEAALQEKKELIQKAVDGVRAMPVASGYVAPAITFIPEPRIAQYLKQRNDEWNASLLDTDNTWWGFNDIDFITRFGKEWLSWYWETAPKEIRTKIFSNDKAAERDLQAQLPTAREIRFWKSEQEFTGSLWVIGEFVVTTNVRQDPSYLIEMRDKTLAHNLRTVFSALWKKE